MEDNILKIFKLVKSASDNEVVKSMSVNLIKLEFDFFLIRKPFVCLNKSKCVLTEDDSNI